MNDSEKNLAREREVDGFRILLVLWDRRYPVFWGTFAGLLLGAGIALFRPPVYSANAVILPKATETSLATGLAQLGGYVGGGGSESGRLGLILNSYVFAESVLVKNGLLPLLLKDQWDPADSGWRHPDRRTIHRGVRVLRKAAEISSEGKQKTLKIEFLAEDSTLPYVLVRAYLHELKARVIQGVKDEADSNRAYLEEQLLLATDPAVRGKIINLIAHEIEKAMLLRSQSYEVIEPPRPPLGPSGPNRWLILFLFLSASFGISVVFSLMAGGIVSGIRDAGASR